MLIQSAINYNLSVSVLDPDPDAPCKHIAERFVQGNLTDYETVYKFGKSCDIITIEIEHVNVEALKQLEADGKLVYPQPHIIELIQDKGSQKMFYQRNNIPSPDFFLVENREQIKRYESYFPFFQKMRKGGYDGKGVMKLDHPSKIESAFDVPSVLEMLIDFEREISVVVSRNLKGEIACFPVVDCDFNPKANLVEFLYSPSETSKDIESQAISIAKTVADKLGIVGLLAVEMFVTRDGKVLVNEMAPRPHNSGHQTIEGNRCSQFDQHLRAILNWPPGDTSVVLPSVMINLLGEPLHEGPAIYEGLEEILSMPGVYVHLYGKKITKPFRKMGHITVTDKSLSAARKKAKTVKEIIKVKS